LILISLIDFNIISYYTYKIPTYLHDSNIK